MIYADYQYYKDNGGAMDEPTAKQALKRASRHIDVLTFCRINAIGFENLEPLQQEIVKETCCSMADFENLNGDMINSLLSSYSLNGTSMSFSGDGANVTVIDGVCVQRDAYQYLSETGLCCRSLRGW